MLVCGTTWYDMLEYGMVWPGWVGCGRVWYAVVGYDLVGYGGVRPG